jgi:dolichol-phosphate mannosyltransferase
MELSETDDLIAVVIPAYKSATTIERVVRGIPGFVQAIIIVDDCSPDDTQARLASLAQGEPRLHILRHAVNRGVGAAMQTGYAAAQQLSAGIIIKMDADDQMDPAYLPALIDPILKGRADYVKGNRFLQDKELKAMPLSRRIGNLGLSFMTKLASGYWNIFDPTNGYTAIHASLLPLIDWDKISQRYFFETSLLLELGMKRAVVKDVSIPARYQGETSSLSELKMLLEFPPKLVAGLLRRFLFLYFLRDFTAVSIFVISGLGLSLFGLVWGIVQWIKASHAGVTASTGTVMIAVLPLMLGMQLILQAMVMDIQNIPADVLHTE